MATDTTDPSKRRNRFYRIGRAAGRQFRKGAPGRRVATEVGGTVIRRGLGRLFRGW